MIGKLLHFTMTRPDIAFEVQTLSQFLQQPKKSPLEAALRNQRYVKNQPGQGMSRKSNSTIPGFCDPDWASYPHSRKSVISYLVKLGDSLITWKSNNQSTVSKSSAESEYRSMASTWLNLYHS